MRFNCTMPNISDSRGALFTDKSNFYRKLFGATLWHSIRSLSVYTGRNSAEESSARGSEKTRSASVKLKNLSHADSSRKIDALRRGSFF